MKKTHKKILGFAGLGVVAAVTTIAAVIPSPLASAVTAEVTDRIEVHITSSEPLVRLSSTGGSEVTDPNYNVKVEYDNLSDILVTIINRNDDGGIIYKESVLLKKDSLAGIDGSDDIAINFDEYGGYGTFTITAVGTAVEGGVPIEKNMVVKYVETAQDVDPGNPIPTPPVPEEPIYSYTYTLTDATDTEITGLDWGSIVKNGGKEFDFSGTSLPDGTYTLYINCLNQHGDVLGVEKRLIVIDRDGTGDDVPITVEDIDGVSKAIVTLRNENGDIIGEPETYDNITVGSKINFTLPNNLPAGLYTLTTDYYDGNNVLLKTIVTTFYKSNTSGVVDIEDIPEKLDTVTTIETNIYDEDGNLVRVLKADRFTGEMKVYDKNGNLISTIANGYKDGHISIPMEGLESGIYTAVIMYKNKYGYLVGGTKTIRIKWDAEKGIIVPDTGSFFEGLNISREDYLLTGLAVFMILGVVAFGVVKKNRNRR